MLSAILQPSRAQRAKSHYCRGPTGAIAVRGARSTARTPGHPLTDMYPHSSGPTRLVGGGKGTRVKKKSSRKRGARALVAACFFSPLSPRPAAGGGGGAHSATRRVRRRRRRAHPLVVSPRLAGPPGGTSGLVVDEHLGRCVGACRTPGRRRA